MENKPNVPTHLKDATDRDGASDRHGTVMSVDPLRHVAQVIDSRDALQKDVPTMLGVGPDGEGDFSTPMPGWRARLNTGMGLTFIDQFTPGATLFKDKNSGEEKDDYLDDINTFLSLTGTPSVYRVIKAKDRNFRSHRPHDLIAGDWGNRTAEGGSIFNLRGGVAGMKVSDLCQVILNQVDDALKLLGRNVDMFADWGEIRLVNEAGKTRLHMKGNATADKTYKDKHDFELSIGSGANFMEMTLYAKDGKTPVHKVAVDQNGNRHVFLARDEMVEIHGNHGTGITGGEKRIVGKDLDIEVDGQYTLKSKHVHLGDRGGQRAPMGDDVVAWFQKIEDFINYQMVLETPMGPTLPGTSFGGFVLQGRPDLQSHVVDYIKD